MKRRTLRLHTLVKLFAFGLVFLNLIESARAQPVMVKDINLTGTSLGLNYPIINLNDTLFFFADDGIHGFELWKSDGTNTGTVMIKDINIGSGNGYVNGSIQVISTMAHSNGIVFFYANDGLNGGELWKTDGTASGTVMVKDINPGSANSDIRYMIDLNGTLFFRADDGINGAELWKSDGTSVGTVMVKDIRSGNLNSNLLFPIVYNNMLFFSAHNGSNGQELWKSDGTTAGTVMVKDLIPGFPSSQPREFTISNGNLFFNAGSIYGKELWKSDGTTAGTVVIDILPGSADSHPLGITDINGTLFFSARISSGVNANRELWKSDGTLSGTVLVKDIYSGILNGSPNGFTEVNGEVFFMAEDATYGRELWKTDGTTSGTVLVKNIWTAGNSDPIHLTNVNDTLYFHANNGASGRELWKSDGTASGTVLVKDINPGIANSLPHNLLNVNGTLFFYAQNVDGRELWKLSPPPPVCLEFFVDLDTAGTGDTLILPVRVNNFNGISTYQGSISFDSTILSVDTIISTNINMVQNFGFPGSGVVPANVITFTAFDPALSTITLPDSSVIIEITFIVNPNASPGLTSVKPDSSVTPLGYSNNPFSTSLMAPCTSSGGIEVLDNIPPTIICPSPITQYTDPGICGAVVNFNTPTGMDNLLGHIVTQTGGPVSGSIFPVGTTPVTFLVTDIGGNTDSCSFDVTVIDTIPPIVITQNITISLDSNSIVSIIPADLDNGSFDLCGIDTFMLDIDTFDCSHVGIPDTVLLTAIDIHGNSASAMALVTVESNPVISLSGAAITEDGDSIPEVDFDLSGDDGPMVQTDSFFNFLVSPCISVNDIGAFKNNDSTTNLGVDVQDAFTIIRHVLNIELLNTPYQLIAADVNGSRFINPNDPFPINILDPNNVLQKIVQIESFFTNPVTGLKDAIWTFIPSDYIFPDPSNPATFDTRRFYVNPNQATDQNFIGVKLGDVDNSWAPDTSNSNILRPAVPLDSIHFVINDMVLKPNQLITIPVRVRNFKNISGYQFTLNWDAQVLEFQSMNNQVLSGIHGTDKVHKGSINSAWVDMSGQGITLADGTTAFEMTFKVVGNGGSQAQFEMTSALTPSKAFNEQGALLGQEIVRHNIIVEETTTSIDPFELKGYKLEQNQPNPFDQSTTIPFSLGQVEEVEISIYNLTGQIIKQFSGKYPAGDHEIIWHGLNEKGRKVSQGMYIIRIKAGQFISSERMIKAK